MHLSHLLLPKNKNIRQFQSRHETFDVRLSMASAKAKEGENTKIQFWSFWSRLTVQGQSGTPPIDSNVFVSVFDVRSELTCASATHSVAEIQEIIGNFSCGARHTCKTHVLC